MNLREAVEEFEREMNVFRNDDKLILPVHPVSSGDPVATEAEAAMRWLHAVRCFAKGHGTTLCWNDNPHLVVFGEDHHYAGKCKVYSYLWVWDGLVPTCPPGESIEHWLIRVETELCA